ncbi:MAG: hypothetical protein AAB254_08540, partial [candidate division NC10 bacterium]
MPRLGLKGLRGITLFQQFSLLSFIWMVITTLVGGYLVATLVTQAALQRELETVSHFVGAQVMQHRLPEVLEGPDYGQRAARLAAAFATLRETAGVVRVKVFDPARLESRPPTFKAMKFKGTEFDGMMYSVQVAPEDCTGCTLCM